MKYITEKVDPHMKELLLSVLLEQPTDVLKYMAEWVYQRKHGIVPKKKPVVKIEKKGEAHVPGQSSKHHDVAKASHAEASKTDDRTKASKHNDHSDDDDDDEVAVLQHKTAAHNDKARAAVSAEVYGKFNKKENFKARVIPKSDEEKRKIREKLLMSFLFKALDEKDLETCIDAMEIKNYK